MQLRCIGQRVAAIPPKNAMKSEEVNYKKNFCERWFDRGTWELDVLNQVDVLLHDRKGNKLLYIETKHHITNETQRRAALAQTILTNRKQDEPLSRVALVYQDAHGLDTLELLDCSDNEVLYNNDFNWAAERPSSPTRDAIDRICDRLRGRTTIYHDTEIAELYQLLKHKQDTIIAISDRNCAVVYNQWKNAVRFCETVSDEQDLINLFLVDMLNGTRYKRSFIADIEDNTLFGNVKVGQREQDTDQDLIREGTNLSHYKIMYDGAAVDGIKYSGNHASTYYTIADPDGYARFWSKYRRPPEKHEFLKIIEHSASLYSDKYRRDTGGEYTPSCFVAKQVEILRSHYNLDDFIVLDPCAGVGNLENQFGKDFKPYCYLSTLEQMDVDICRIKGFENTVQFDYLNDPHTQPQWKYKGTVLPIDEICRREGRKLMVVMNPPYQRRKDFKYDLCIEFFRKAVKLNPDVIVYYCKTEFFLRDTVSVFANSGYRIVSHIFSNAKDTFKLSEWSVSQVVFDKYNGTPINPETITAERYDYDEKNDKLSFVRPYTYDNAKPNLIKEIELRIKECANGLTLGQWSYLSNVLIVSNGGKEKQNKITTGNLDYSLLSKGINFNSHTRYFEWNYLTYRGFVDDIPKELFSDSIMFSLFFKNNMFSNRGQRNYIMPFTAGELGCDLNDLNVLFPDHGGDLFSNTDDQKPFDFRDWFHRYDYSTEALALYRAALALFRWYHSQPQFAASRDWNDSFYDITNAIMGKDTSQFAELDRPDDRRITKVKTTKGTRGFGRNTVKYAVPSADLPLFTAFFDARDALALKINRQLVDSGLLLWPRENIY